MQSPPNKTPRRPSRIVTAMLWLLSVGLIVFGGLGLIGLNASSNATTAGYITGYVILSMGLGFGIWARRRKHTKGEATEQDRTAVEVDEPGFTWDGDADSPEALEAAFRGDDVPALADGTIPGPVPPHIVGSLPLASESLGGFLRSYPSNRGGLVRASIMAAVFTCLAIVCIQLPHQKPPQPGEEGLVFGMFYTFAALCMLMGLGILWTTFASSGRTFHLFEDGIVEVTGKNSRAIPFSQIELCSEISEFKLIALHHIKMYWFDLTDNASRIQIDGDTTQNAAELGDFIQARVFDRLLPQTVDAIKAGLKLSWGPVTIDANFISFGFRGTYRWDRIRSLGIARLGGSVVVHTGRFPKSTGIRPDAIPNSQLLFRVSEQLACGA